MSLLQGAQDKRAIKNASWALANLAKSNSDNKAAISQLCREEFQTKHFANFLLSSDWDIISTTALITKQLPQHEYVWTKGHQDKTIERTLLSFLAQLNCEADDEAGIFQQNNTTHPIVPMIPFTKAQL